MIAFRKIFIDSLKNKLEDKWNKRFFAFGNIITGNYSQPWKIFND